ncbi:helix-turn-helix domain-containing protein [candidate division KSB1 bacterium]
MGSCIDGILESVKREIEESAHLKITVSGLAKKYKISRKELHYRFVQKYGISILDYHKELKFELFNKLIRVKNGRYYRTSFDIATSLGFANDSGLQYFIKKMSGMYFSDYLHTRVIEPPG